MKILTFTATVLATILLLSFTSVKHGDGKYTVDASKSSVEWIGKKLTGKHMGSLTLKSGEIVIGGHGISSANFDIDMTTIKCTDMTGESAEDLENHLKADDFFGTKKFPIASIVLVGASPITDGKDGHNFSIKGNLTIKEITNEVTFPATVTIGDKQVEVKAKVVFDRTKWGIKYKSKSVFDDLGDKFIYDDIELNINLVANLQ